jgi:hypothetical protein
VVAVASSEKVTARLVMMIISFTLHYCLSFLRIN